MFYSVKYILNILLFKITLYLLKDIEEVFSPQLTLAHWGFQFPYNNQRVGGMEIIVFGKVENITKFSKIVDEN